MLKIELSNITNSKNIIFKYKKSKLFKSCKINYFVKKDDYSRYFFYRKRELHYVLKKIENFFGVLPSIKKINVKIKNKKKKFLSTNYIYMGVDINNNFELFFYNFFIKNVYFSVFNIVYKNISYQYIQELFCNFFYKKYYFNYNVFSFKLDTDLFNLVTADISYLKRKVFCFEINFFGKFSKYINNFVSVFFINFYKLILLYYKYFKNRSIKI